jgi:hypothetical protein
VKPYRHKLSREVDGKRFATRIVADECGCVPPPHQHHHPEAGLFSKLIDFTRGTVVEVEGAGGEYTIRNE